MAALRFGLKCSRTNVYAPLLNLIGALPLNGIYNFETAFRRYLKRPAIEYKNRWAIQLG
jgi:hypothetical protein